MEWRNTYECKHTYQKGSGDVIIGEAATAMKLYANADGSYTILADSTKAFDVYGISKDAGANICLWTYWGGNGQKWVLVPAAPAEPKTVRGDLNTDGEFNVADLVLMQKWLLAVPGTELADWQAGDLCEDGRLDVLDLCAMRSELADIV